MEAYRDQYATIFNNGRDVVSINVSTDADTTLAAWAREGDFPMLFASDVGGAAGRVYGVFDDARNLDRRVVFIIGPDGRIVHRALPFNAMSGDAYTEMGTAIDKAAPKR